MAFVARVARQVITPAALVFALLLAFGILAMRTVRAIPLAPHRSPAVAPAQPARERSRWPATGSSPIQHVVIMIQENRSFDNLFQNFPGANTQAFGQLSNGQTEQLKPLEMNIGFD